MDAANGPFLTTSEVADLLAVSPFTVRRLITRGELRAVKYGDSPASPVRVPTDEVTRFLERSQARAAAHCQAGTR